MRLGPFLLMSNIQIKLLIVTIMLLIMIMMVFFMIGMIENLKLLFDHLLGIEAESDLAIDLTLELLLVIVDVHKVPLRRVDLKEIERYDDGLLGAAQEEHIAVLVEPQLECRLLIVEVHREQMGERLEIRMIVSVAEARVEVVSARELHQVVVESQHE